MLYQFFTKSRTTLYGMMALACLAIFSAKPAALGGEWSSTTRYAALAVHDTTGAYGYVWNYGAREEAERAAMRWAGGGSRVVLSTTAPFFAFAKAPLGGWGAADGQTPEEAKSRALEAAREHSLWPTIKFCQYNGPEE